MIVKEDIGKRIIIFDPNKQKWEPANWVVLTVVDSIENGINKQYAVIQRGDKTFKWLTKWIRAIDTP